MAREYMVRPMPPALSAEEIRDANTRYHDVAAGHYDSKWGIDFGELGASQVTAKVRKALGGEPSHYPRSLEIGSGTGYFTLNLLRAGLIGEATCTDISAGMLDTLEANAAELGLEVHTEPADAERLPFEDGVFDLVLGHAVLHHIPDLPRAFAEFERVLAPGGTILFAGEPSRYGDRLASLPKRFARTVAPLWRRAVGAATAHAGDAEQPDAGLEGVVDVHAFSPGELRGSLAPPACETCVSAARSFWQIGSAGPTARWRPARTPRMCRWRGGCTPITVT